MSCSNREPLRGRLVERWGAEVAPDGEVDRNRIGEVVFADPEQLTWLEQQIHPLVGERIAAWLAALPETGTEVAVVEVPLLFEGEMRGGLRHHASRSSPTTSVRRERAAARGHALVDEREARQLTQDEKAERAEHVVDNDGSVEDLRAGAVRADREAAAMKRRARRPALASALAVRGGDRGRARRARRRWSPAGPSTRRSRN